MNKKLTHIAHYSLRIFLMVFWLYVAMDKLWDLPGFHRALLSQPFPDVWADVLYIGLPLIELGLSMLFIFSRQRLPFLLSALLMFLFTLYIGLGTIGLYAERPCGCASVFSGLSWTHHFIINIVLLSLSILGRYLTGPTAPIEPGRTYYSEHIWDIFHRMMALFALGIYQQTVIIRKRFPRRFAPFPGWAGVVLNYDTCAYPVKSIAEAKDR